MDYKETWESIGKFFYTTNFGLVITAVLVWDESLFELIPQIRYLQWYSFIIFVGVLILLAYFIIDWLDAIIVTKIDDKITLLDIASWLLAPILLSFTIAILLKKGTSSTNWMCFGLSFYTFFNSLILFFRNRLIYDEAKYISLDKLIKSIPKRGEDNSKEKEYISIIIYQLLDKILGVIYLVLAVFFILNVFFKCVSHLQILIIFLLVIIINFILKMLRHLKVNIPVYNKKMESTRSEITKNETIIK